MIKWKLLLTTLPVVVVMVLLKTIMEHILELPGWVDFSDVAPVLTAGAFLVGFMLAGTMADYKESEKLPSVLATTLETLDDLIELGSIKREFDPAAARRSLFTLGAGILDWLAKRVPVDTVHSAIEAMNPHFQAMDQAGSTQHANRAIVYLNIVRRTVGRIDVVSRTGFLPTGYAILQVMVGAILVLLLIARFKTLVAEFVLIASITLIYVYMLRLIRDIDDPFEYGPDLQRRGAAEVDLFPITEFLARAESRPRADSPQGGSRD